MAEDRRKDAATAATGAVLLGSGGAMRHVAVHRAFPGAKPRIHALAMLRRAPKGKRQFWAGSAIGALGLPPLAVGSTRLIRGDVEKIAPKVVLHGTSTPVARRIMRRGFQGAQGRAGAHGVYVFQHDEMTDATSHALYAAQYKAPKPRPRGKVVEAMAVGPARRGADTLGYEVYQPDQLIPVQTHGATRRGALRRWQAVDKADQDKRGFWREGISGSGEALRQRAQSYREPVPVKLRAAQLGVGAGVGALGSLAARAALGRRGNALKPLLTPVAGGLAATASVPLSNKVVTRRHPEYEVTAAGVRRKKTAVKMPSTKSSPYRPQPRSFRTDVGKSALDDARSRSYQGSRTPYIRQRAAITAAGHPPVIGPFTQAAAAARYAPPGQGRKQGLRQFGMASAAGLPIGAAGAYGGAHLVARSKTAEGIATDAMRAKHAMHTTARRAVGLPEKAERGPGKLTRRFLATEAGKPFRTKAGAVGGAAGFLGAKMASGTVLGQAAISLNQRDQRRYNKAHEITKAAGPGQTKREKHQLAQRKRRSAVLQTAGGVASLGSLGLLASGHRGPALTLGTIGSGIGGTNALIGARVQRQEAHVVDPVHKAGPIEIKGSKHEHRQLLRTYGDKGPLPKGLDRDTRMKAWEARYVHHGGHQQNRYARRAEIGEGIKNAGLATATAGGAAWLATRGKRGAALAAKHPRLRHKAETVAGAGATVGGAGEMLAGWAHHRQSSYASSPGGVAASALRRMRDNTPDPS